MKKKLKNRFKSPVNPHKITHQIPLHSPLIHPHSSIFPTNHPPNHPTNHPHYTDSELRLINEVIYLHSLWHRGPPSQPSPNPFLRPSQNTHFKKPKKHYQSSDKEWPIGPDSTCQTHSGQEWPAFPAQIKPTSRLASEEERARVLGVKVQLKGVESCASLFRGRNKDNGGGSGGESENESDDDDEEEMEEFMEKVFEESGELREFYVKNCKNGEFYCLICGVIGNKIGRKYKNCVALVQHAVSISKTKKRVAHRAYGRAVCKVLGWDIDQLPAVQSAIEDDVAGGGGGGLSCEKSSEAEVKSHTDVGSTTVVGVEGDAEISNKNHAEQKDVPDTVEKHESACMDVTCTTSELNYSQTERNGSTNGSELETHDVNKETLCGKSDKAPSQQQNTPKLVQEDAVNKVGEGHSELGQTSAECGLALTGDDAYKQLPCLSNDFQIPK